MNYNYSTISFFKFSVYLLPDDRNPLVLYDRYEHTDNDWGVCIEPGIVVKLFMAFSKSS